MSKVNDSRSSSISNSNRYINVILALIVLWDILLSTVIVMKIPCKYIPLVLTITLLILLIL